MADLGVPPNKAKIRMAWAILVEEGFTEWAKQQIKERLFQLDLTTVDPDMIGAEVIQARHESRNLDWFMNQLEEYIK